LIELARTAYISVGGTGYGRVDIRTRTPESRDAFVLEVNANCGLAFGRLASSLGEILILSKVVSWRNNWLCFGTTSIIFCFADCCL
jgi:hypothetical protein